MFERHFAYDLLRDDGRCVGVVALDDTGRRVAVRATNVVLATGGAGQLFAVTTNPLEATGDGTAMALRAGVAVADVEFLQFHPTALHVATMPRPLLTEALRGHGAVLRGPDGERFTDELQPRDVVSRAETAVMIDTHADHVWLDATGLADFPRRFPNIASELGGVGLDPATDWLPVAPAAHYCSGGVMTDLSGASSLPGLWAAGEAACTGVHGANRLASNSLLEGLVFGPRVVEAIVAGQTGPRPTGVMRAVLDGRDHGSDGREAIGVRPVAVDDDPAAAQEIPGSGKRRGLGGAGGGGETPCRAATGDDLRCGGVAQRREPRPCRRGARRHGAPRRRARRPRRVGVGEPVPGGSGAGPVCHGPSRIPRRPHPHRPSRDRPVLPGASHPRWKRARRRRCRRCRSRA